MNAFLAILVCVLVVEITTTNGAKSLSSTRRLTCTPIQLLNGKVRYKPKSGFAQFMCNKSYILAGEKYMKCIHGKWEGDIPTCVRNTCKSISMPKNGFAYPTYRGGALTFFCMPNYELHGPQLAYCDGKKWSNYLPSCIESKRNVSLTCDFEHEDLCGWSHDINHDFDWIRLKNSTPSWHVGTGPSHDHTYGTSAEGYYMYIEATSKKLNDTARLISPVYKKQENDTCLEFFYHMHGSTMGELRVYLKKVKENWDLSPNDACFTVSGNQGNVWRRSFIEFGPITDDFQIIMEGVRGSSYLSDIAIDDVRLIENCLEEVEETTSITSTTNNEIEDDFIYESCNFRCGIKHGNNSLCDCDDTCFIHGTCCADYISVCLLNDLTEGDSNENTTPEYEEMETTDSEDTTPTEEEPCAQTTLPTEEYTTSQSKSILNKQNQTQPILIPNLKPVKYSTMKTLSTTSKKLTPMKTTTTTPKKPTTTLKKLTTTTLKTPTTLLMKPTTSIPKKSATIIPKHITHIFNRSVKWNRIKFFQTTVIQSITKPPIRRLPNYKKSYANNNSFKEKENDYFKNDMLTVAPNTNDEELNSLLISTEVPKKLASLLQLEHTNGVNDAKVETSGMKTIIYVSVGLLCVGVLLTVYVVQRRMACMRIKRMRNGSYGDSASDVRYLTSDEKLDFTLATPY